MPDVVVVGAGMVGAACAYELARAGADVCVVDRGSIAAGTTSAGEGNVLVSDKPPGAELDLAVRSRERWCELEAELGDAFELERKGGVVVASDAAALDGLRDLALAQAEAGVESTDVTGAQLWALEPALSREVAGALRYPGDLQVQPMLACAALLRGAAGAGARFLQHAEVEAIETHGGRVRAVRTGRETVACDAVVNAAGPWSGRVAELAGAALDVRPRRGVVLVTEPLPPTVFHKVYAAEYVGDVASSSADLQTSPVVEGTPSGTVLIGASRELAGFDRTMSAAVLARLAAGAVRLFPVLGDVSVIRAYAGLRPYVEDHLPVIGPDPVVGGLWHACGHEGAGIGLAPATAELVAAGLAGTAPSLDAAPFDPARLAGAAA